MSVVLVILNFRQEEPALPRAQSVGKSYTAKPGTVSKLSQKAPCFYVPTVHKTVNLELN